MNRGTIYNAKGAGKERGEVSHILTQYSGPSFSDFPRVILINILLRLSSTKSIFVCKCVCKTWCDVISDPEFANHIDVVRQTDSNYDSHFSSSSQTYSEEEEEDDVVGEVEEEEEEEEEEDCESMADNIGGNLVERWRNRHKRRQFESDCENMTYYIWTDERLQLLVTTFYDYVMNPRIDFISFSDPSERRLLLLGKLRTELLTLATNAEIPDSPTVDDITDELNEFVLLFHGKYPRYYDLKERLGETIRKQFRVLLRHERFDDYVAIGVTSHRILHPPSAMLSKSPGRDFYWTDKRLQHLVNSYYMLLDDAKSDSRGQGTSEKCLVILKRKLSWDDKVPELRKKLNTIFENYEKKSFDYREFRIRIGKDACIYFDHLVNLDWNLYKKKSTPYSKSGGSSSGLKSSASWMSLTDQRNANSHRIRNELMKSELELNSRQIAIAMFKLADDNMRSAFWACSAEERKYFVEELIK